VNDLDYQLADGENSETDGYDDDWQSIIGNDELVKIFTYLE
jgi:hypothetical protein